ncbi:MAG: hypothetical protein ACK53Y_06610, partial [bacterium]
MSPKKCFDQSLATKTPIVFETPQHASRPPDEHDSSADAPQAEDQNLELLTNEELICLCFLAS